MARISAFTKIDGYKHIIKCRMCGKKTTSPKNDSYCKECAEKLKKEWEANQKHEDN